jgi:hypothetical protein
VSENPRVGGSIPPLTTMQINISNQEIASERMGPLSNIRTGVQYLGPLLALTSLALVTFGRDRRVAAQPGH